MTLMTSAQTAPDPNIWVNLVQRKSRGANQSLCYWLWICIIYTNYFCAALCFFGFRFPVHVDLVQDPVQSLHGQESANKVFYFVKQASKPVWVSASKPCVVDRGILTYLQMSSQTPQGGWVSVVGAGMNSGIWKKQFFSTPVETSQDEPGFYRCSRTQTSATDCPSPDSVGCWCGSGQLPNLQLVIVFKNNLTSKLPAYVGYSVIHSFAACLVHHQVFSCQHIVLFFGSSLFGARHKRWITSVFGPEVDV